jgi:hypothetical protein
MTQLLEPSLPEQTVWVPPACASPQEEVSQVVVEDPPPPPPWPQLPVDEPQGLWNLGLGVILAAALPAWAAIRSTARVEARVYMVCLAFEGPCGPG